ncbi:hypothetical protein BpHYR1_017698 [Brachionus plicatilis]|uniref:Uncharacterized protein n=1 Tax=Brachionus plicatilis TaxID=10195 RepID=A0A3M7S9D0_BRAPC|nr:hypothetical protein BpHYR1_017698 [Brachionus plicatilis]
MPTYESIEFCMKPLLVSSYSNLRFFANRKFQLKIFLLSYIATQQNKAKKISIKIYHGDFLSI